MNFGRCQRLSELVSSLGNLIRQENQTKPN